MLPSRRESTVDIEEANSLLDGTILEVGVLVCHLLGVKFATKGYKSDGEEMNWTRYLSRQ